MTNGEMIQKVFNCEVCEPLPEDDIIHVIFPDKNDSAIGFDWSWWNMEYKEPTAKNKLGVDCISRESIKQKLQKHHDFFVNAYGGFSNLPQNDKSRVDEITNCIAMVVNEPPVTPQEPILDKIRAEIAEHGSIWVQYQISGRSDEDIKQLVRDVLKQAKEQVLDVIDKYKAEVEPQESRDEK